MKFQINGRVEIRPLYNDKVVLIENENVSEPIEQSTQIRIPDQVYIRRNLISNIQTGTDKSHVRLTTNSN